MVVVGFYKFCPVLIFLWFSGFEISICTQLLKFV